MPSSLVESTPGQEAERSLDLRLLPAAVGAEAGAALGLVVPWRLCLLLVAVSTAAGLVAARRARAGGRAAVACLLLVLAGTLLAAEVRLESRRSGPVTSLARQEAVGDFEVVLTGDPQPVAGSVRGDALRHESVVMPARLTSVRAAGDAWRVRQPVLLIAPAVGWSTLLPSQPVRLTGKLAAPRGSDVAAVVLVRGPPNSVGQPSRLQQAAGSVRAGLRRASAGLPADARSLLPGLVLGDTSGMSPELRDDARTAGLSHLTAVSGANCAMVLAVLLALLRPTPLRRRGRVVVALLGLAGFVLLARPSPSVLRAAVMGSVALLGLALGRPRATVPALLGAVTVLVLIDPDLAITAGFVLSVLATGALVIVAPGWSAALGRRLPRPLASALAVPLAAQAAVTPVIVLLSGAISLIAVPANLLAAPAVPPATILGVLAAVLSLLSRPLASVVARVAGVPCAWIADVAHRSAAFPHGSIAWPRGAGGVLLAVAAVLAAVAVARRRSLRRAAVVALVGVVLTGWLVVPRTLPRWPPSAWQIVACDIGQGDALLLRGSAHVAPVLVDAGPDPRPLRRCLDELDVHSLSAVVLSHLHADHVEGLPAVLGHVPTPVVLVNPLDEPALEGRRVRGWAARARTPVSVLDAGQSFAAAGIGFDVLGPAPVLHGTDSDPNNDSLVLLARFPGLRMLLTGDVQPEAQENLLAHGVPQVDVLKVPHHGSAHQDDRFLRATGARLSLTSVGAGNPYGHPSVQTERTLAQDGTTDLRTDLDGSVAITLREHRPIAVPQRRNGPGQPVALPADGHPRPPAVATSTAPVAAPLRGLAEATLAPAAASAGPGTAPPEPRARSPCPQSGVPRPPSRRPS